MADASRDLYTILLEKVVTERASEKKVKSVDQGRGTDVPERKDSDVYQKLFSEFVHGPSRDMQKLKSAVAH